MEVTNHYLHIVSYILSHLISYREWFRIHKCTTIWDMTSKVVLEIEYSWTQNGVQSLRYHCIIFYNPCICVVFTSYNRWLIIVNLLYQWIIFHCQSIGGGIYFHTHYLIPLIYWNLYHHYILLHSTIPHNSIISIYFHIYEKKTWQINKKLLY